MSRWPRVFEGEKLLQIAMPMGGLGAGCVCLNGFGGIQDFSVRNVPATSNVPDGHEAGDAAFALIRVNGVARLIEGPYPKELIYNQGTQAQGNRKGGHEGLPRFASSVFKGQFPFGTVELSDPKIPVSVSVKGWSPFIPLDDLNSGIPAAILDYTITNTSDAPVEVEFSYHLSHLARADWSQKSTRNRVIPNSGAYLYNAEEPNTSKFGSCALAVVGHSPSIKAAWFRGGWFDSMTALWQEVSSGTFSANDGTHCDAGLEGRNGASIMVAVTLPPGESVIIPVVLAWHFPNPPFSTTGGGTDKETEPWVTWYATKWRNAGKVAEYVVENYDSLRSRTEAFSSALYSTTIPDEALDAVASNLSLLKSPTILRQASGAIWGWEGCFPGSGCCAGSCTHVWNYAQAMCHLFPQLERTLREQEYDFAMDDRGHVNFRASVPDRPADHGFHAAADGQLGGIMKLYRDWQISGDTEWMKRLYPAAKKSIDYCIETWDPRHEGALLEPHHNTYDIEFWGADGMCTTIYQGALSAFASMTAALKQDPLFYEDLMMKSVRYLDGKLFNGEYYEQKVQWEGLRDESFAKQLATYEKDAVDRALTEMETLLLKEGPKYQYGSGCISDGVIGAWMTQIYGIPSMLEIEYVRRNLKAIFNYNFKEDLSEHACPQRPGYAMGHEAGLLLCSWPRGGKPTLPFVYSDEVWTGIEYQVASHAIELGLVEEGLKIVAAARSRYDGHTRNPYNEYECGSYYARAMASYAVLNALSGFRYSASSKSLWLEPKIKGPFTTFFSAASGFGTISIDGDEVTINVVEGELQVDEFIIRGRQIRS